MKFQLYFFASVVGAILIINYAAISRQQFYPATVYLVTSKLSVFVSWPLTLLENC